MEFTNSTYYTRRKDCAENGHWKLHSSILHDLMIGVLNFIAQNYFRRLAPKHLFWVMVEVAVVHNTCKAQKAGFLASKPEVTLVHLHHLLGACPNTPGLGRLPIPPSSPRFLATRDSEFIASRGSWTFDSCLRNLSGDTGTQFLPHLHCFGNVHSKWLSEKRGLNRDSCIVQTHILQ